MKKHIFINTCFVFYNLTNRKEFSSSLLNALADFKSTYTQRSIKKKDLHMFAKLSVPILSFQTQFSPNCFPIHMLTAFFLRAFLASGIHMKLIFFFYKQIIYECVVYKQRQDEQLPNTNLISLFSPLVLSGSCFNKSGKNHQREKENSLHKFLFLSIELFSSFLTRWLFLWRRLIRLTR